MNLTFRQHILLLSAITVFYDEVAKTDNSEMKHEIMELADIIQEAAEKMKNEQDPKEP
jgi:hypothetical protein